MSILAKYLPFVEGQSDFHLRKAEDSRETPGISKKHRSSSEKFKMLSADLALADRKLDEAEIALKPVKLLRSINLLPDELDGLPDALVSELISDSDRIEREIYKILEECGGIASLDRIILTLYRRTGDVHKRAATTSRLYRMAQKGFAFPVPGKKGVYSIKQLSEAETEKLFASEQAPMNEST